MFSSHCQCFDACKKQHAPLPLVKHFASVFFVANWNGQIEINRYLGIFRTGYLQLSLKTWKLTTLYTWLFKCTGLSMSEVVGGITKWTVRKIIWRFISWQFLKQLNNLALKSTKTNFSYLLLFDCREKI